MAVLSSTAVQAALKKVITTPVKKPTAPTPTAAKKPGTPTGSVNKPTVGNSTPGGVGHTLPNGKPAPVTAVKPKPTVDQWLGSDTAYQNQLASLNKQLADYRAQNANDLSQYDTNYAQNARDIGINRDRSVTENTNDFAGRGLFHSGLFAKASGDVINDFTNQSNKLDVARGQYQQNASTSLQNYMNENQLAIQRARQEAINRRSLTLEV